MTETEQTRIFGDWLAQHKGLIFKVLRAYAFTTMDREDLFQDITVQLWRSVPSFRNESATTTWIYRIALNTAIKWVQKEQRHGQRESLDNDKHIILETMGSADHRLVWIYEEISMLNEVDRSVALLFLDSFSYKEMAAILGISESNVGVKINRIKKHLISKAKKINYHGI